MHFNCKNCINFKIKIAKIRRYRLIRGSVNYYPKIIYVIDCTCILYHYFSFFRCVRYLERLEYCRPKDLELELDLDLDLDLHLDLDLDLDRDRIRERDLEHEYVYLVEKGERDDQLLELTELRR